MISDLYDLLNDMDVFQRVNIQRLRKLRSVGKEYYYACVGSTTYMVKFISSFNVSTRGGVLAEQNRTYRDMVHQLHHSREKYYYLNILKKKSIRQSAKKLGIENEFGGISAKTEQRTCLTIALNVNAFYPIMWRAPKILVNFLVYIRTSFKNYQLQMHHQTKLYIKNV